MCDLKLLFENLTPIHPVKLDVISYVLIALGVITLFSVSKDGDIFLAEEKKIHCFNFHFFNY